MSISIYNSQLAAEIAGDLLSIGAIKLNPDNPFTWASGWKSPIYCDNRLSLSHPAIRSKIKTALSLAISNSFSGIDAIAGVATAGIPQGALVADELDLPFLYVRSKSKGHGLQNMIEGHVEKGQKIVLVEDLVSTWWEFSRCCRCTQKCRSRDRRYGCNFHLWIQNRRTKLQGQQGRSCRSQ